MNLTLHHFRKEARYLLPRWSLWIVLLIIELMINLEWLMPMSVQGDMTPAFSVVVTWLTALVMMLTQVPEDSAASPARFLATRPLPPSSYWLARALVFLVMIVLPFAMQQGAYLALSQRPMSEVLSGMNTQALRVIGAFGWIVPLSALWKGWRWMLATVLSIAGFTMAFQFMGDRRFSSADTVLLSWHIGLGLVAIGILSLLAWVHRRWEWRVSWRLTALAGCIVLLALMCKRWQITNWNDTAVDMAQAEALTKQAQIELPTESLDVFKPYRTQDGALMLSGEASIQRLPPNVTVIPLPQQAIAHANGARVAVHPFEPLPTFLPLRSLIDYTGRLDRETKAVQTNLPPGTILTLQGNPFLNQVASTVLAAFDEPLPDQHQPINIATDIDLMWQDWKSLIEIPLKDGATASSPEATWTLLHVRCDQGLRGKPVPGAVTIDYRVECRGGIESAYEFGLKLLLMAPDRRIAWTPTARIEQMDARAMFTGWTRRLRTTTWDHVLRYTDGEPVDVNRDNLKLIVLEPRHLGTTRMTWKSPPLKLADHRSTDESWNYTTDEGLYTGRELQAFERRVASLKLPPPGAAKLDVVRYLYDVLSAAATMKFDPQAPPSKLRELLAAVAKDHLAVMLEMSDSMASKWADLLSEILAPLLTEQHKTELINHLAGRAWLAPLVMQRGWEKDAVPALVPALKTKKPIDAYLIKLVLKASDDDAVLRLLLENFRLHPQRNYQIIDHLVRRPSMRAEVKAVAEELWASFDPTLQLNQDNRLRLAIKFGNATALDYALRIASLAGEPGGDGRRLVFDLPDLLGLPRKPKDAKIAELAPSYRHLKASDFEYQPDTMLWKPKP